MAWVQPPDVVAEALNRSQIATGSQKHGDPRYPPFAFTEHGAIVAATILNSPLAVKMSVYVVRAFVMLLDWMMVRSKLPVVIHADYRGDRRIHVVFDDDVAGTVDFAQWLSGPVFEPLKDEHYFRRFFIDGGTVAWPNGADIAPETLYEAVHSSQAA